MREPFSPFSQARGDDLMPQSLESADVMLVSNGDFGQRIRIVPTKCDLHALLTRNIKYSARAQNRWICFFCRETRLRRPIKIGKHRTRRSCGCTGCVRIGQDRANLKMRGAFEDVNDAASRTDACVQSI